MTVVVREPEWTDDDRRQMRELELYEQGLHRCGVHRDMLEDKSNLFMPEEWVCPVCAGLELRARMLRSRDEKRVDKAQTNGPQPADGREIRMRLLVGAEAERVRQVLAERSALEGS